MDNENKNNGTGEVGSFYEYDLSKGRPVPDAPKSAPENPGAVSRDTDATVRLPNTGRDVPPTVTADDVVAEIIGERKDGSASRFADIAEGLGDPSERARARSSAQNDDTQWYDAPPIAPKTPDVPAEAAIVEAPAEAPAADGAPNDAETVSDGGARARLRRPRRRDSDDFKINFDFESEYEDVPTDGPLRVRRRRRSGCLGGVFFAIFVICVSIVLAAMLWLAAADVLGLGSQEMMVQVTIPKDYTLEDVTEILRNAGLIKYESVFKLYSKFSSGVKDIVPGTYELSTTYDYRALVHGMSAQSGYRLQLDVTFPEGYSMAQMFNLLEAEGVCSAEDLWEAAAEFEFTHSFLQGLKPGDRHRLEGYLFPDTYTFYSNDTASRVLKKMLDTFDVRFSDEFEEKAEEMGLTIDEVIIIASMIEREAGTDSDRPLIASVIYNRLASEDMPRLEIDATIHYAIAETEETFSTSLDNPYNTYRNEGLPPGPISNPGLKSIEAALNPSETGYFFYALTKERHHKFSETYDEHLAFVNSDEYGG